MRPLFGVVAIFGATSGLWGCQIEFQPRPYFVDERGRYIDWMDLTHLPIEKCTPITDDARIKTLIVKVLGSAEVDPSTARNFKFEARDCGPRYDELLSVHRPDAPDVILDGAWSVLYDRKRDRVIYHTGEG